MPDPILKGILVVEDSSEDARLLQFSFEQIGLLNPVEVLPTATDAIAYLRGWLPYSDRVRYPSPGVIFLDLKLPGMDGFEFLDWLKGHPEFNDVLVVAISGLDDLASIRRAYALGADSFLMKPCRVPDLENLIQWFPGCWARSSPIFSQA